MARGWESKAVEEQQQDRQRQERKRSEAAPVDVEREQRRRTLELARSRAVDDLGRARNAAHSAMLERAIAAIDEQLRGA